jgi:hypothetical protein
MSVIPPDWATSNHQNVQEIEDKSPDTRTPALTKDGATKKQRDDEFFENDKDNDQTENDKKSDKKAKVLSATSETSSNLDDSINNIIVQSSTPSVSSPAKRQYLTSPSGFLNTDTDTINQLNSISDDKLPTFLAVTETVPLNAMEIEDSDCSEVKVEDKLEQEKFNNNESGSEIMIVDE